MMRGPLLALLLLLPLVAAQGPADGSWSQHGGDAGRSRYVVLPDHPFDVLGTGSLLEIGETLKTWNGVPLVEVPGGLVALAGTASIFDEARCSFLLIRSLAPLDLQRRPIEACPIGTRILGTHAGAGLLFLCRYGSAEEVALEAFDARTLEVRWRFGLSANAPRTPSPTLAAATAYTCHGVIEEDRIVVVFSARARNEIVALALDGSPLWSTHVPSTLGRKQIFLELPAEDPTSGLDVDHLVASRDGYFAWGSQSESQTSYIAWFDRDGRLFSGVLENVGPEGIAAENTDAAVIPDLSPTASDDKVAFVLGGELKILRATDRFPETADLPTPTAPGSLVWWRDAVVYPVHFAGLTPEIGVVTTTPGGPEPWTWKAPQAHVLSYLAEPGGELVVLSATAMPEAQYQAVSWLDLRSRTELARVELPAFRDDRPTTFDLDPVTVFVEEGELMPLSGGRLLAVSMSGHYTLLGQAEDALLPGATLDDDHPAAFAEVVLTLAPQADAVATRIAWGDGVFDETNGTSATHEYVTPGTRVIQVTSVFADGRTATREVAVHVGAARPQELTALQRAFSAENQELSFFVLGLALTGGGALFAAVLRRRRHSRLADEETLLRRVVDASLRDPTTGLAGLAAHRAHLRTSHMRRRLDDAQFGLLDHRTVRAMKSVRYRLLGSVLDQLSPHYRRLLDTALEDGQVTAGEMAALTAGLDEERGLSPGARERLRALLDSWAH